MGKSFAEKLPMALRTYKTEKFIRVDVPRVGIFFRFWQLMAALLVLAQLYLDDGWALSEVPGGMVNAWDEPGTMLASTNDVVARRAAADYCSGSDYDYSKEDYQYTSPRCEALLPAEVGSKGVGSVFYTTAYIETHTKGWPCAATYAAERRTACEALSPPGAFFERLNGQCGCVQQRPIFVLAVEEMGLVFEHAFFTSAAVGLQGSSATMYSEVFDTNGTILKRFTAGEVVRLPLTEWLSAANVSLNASNDLVLADDNGVHPRFRTTGINIKVNIEYTNADPNSKRAIPGKIDVHANIALSAEQGTWTGTGVQTIWAQYPANQDRDVPQDYHLVEKWRQGILFQFTTSGKIYAANIFYLLAVFTSGLVMLKFANTITNLYAFNCLGAESVVLRNKRVELASKKSEFAEIGMKAALAAATYPKFDRYCDGTIEAEDIARAFANVEVDGAPLDWEVAYMIAKNILDDADTEPSFDGEVPGLNYVEFMTCIEGDSINFESFLKDVRTQFDEHMLKDEARDAAAGKKKAPGKGEKTAKQKMQEAKKVAAAKKVARAEAARKGQEKINAEAKKAKLSVDDFLAKRDDEEDDGMRQRCEAAWREERERIDKAKADLPEDPMKKKKKAKGGEEEDGGAVASAPEPGEDLGLSDEAKEERVGKSGKLTLKLASANGLKAADKEGTSDPYVLAKLGKGKKKVKSAVCKATTAPEWDEELELKTTVSLKTVIKNGLELNIMDADKGMLDSDDSIGVVSADLAALATTNSISFHEAVPEGGVLVFSIVWEEGDAVDKEKKKEKKKKEETPRAEPSLDEQGETTQTL